MNEVMWREVMDSCNRDAPCRLDLTLATPLVAQGAVGVPALLTCGPEIQPVLGWHVKVCWEELGCPMEQGEHCLNPCRPCSLPAACHKPRMETFW